jgi:hypothetical protein
MIKDCKKKIADEKKEKKSKESESNITTKKTSVVLFIVSLLAFSSRQNDIWYVNSRASQHMTPNLNNFCVYNAIFPTQYVLLGDDNKHPISGEGIVSIMTFEGKLRKINDVLHVSSLTKNLLSMRNIVIFGYKVLFQNNKCILSNEEGKGIIEAILENDLYRLKNHNIVKKTLAIETNRTMSNIKLWHRRLGHINNEKLKQLKDKNLVKGLSLNEITNCRLCKGCVEGKRHKRKFPKDGGK